MNSDAIMRFHESQALPPIIQSRLFTVADCLYYQYYRFFLMTIPYQAKVAGEGVSNQLCAIWALSLCDLDSA